MMLVNLSVLSAKPTGISIYAKNVVPHLVELDSFTLLSESSLIPLVKEDVRQKIPAGMSPDFGMQGHAKRLLWTQFGLPKLYKKLKANLIFSPLPETPLYTSCCNVAMVHDLIPLRYPDRRSPLQYYQKFVLPKVLYQAEHLVCNSQATADDVINYFGIPARKITPIPLAYDAKHFRAIDNLPQPTKPYFLYLGRHNPHKNVLRMIKAFAQLPNYQDYEFLLVGSQDKRYTPTVKALITELGLEQNVLIKDYVAQQDLPMIINQAIALVFTTLWEGFGLPVLEAMACGTPVVTSNQSALPEAAGDAALLVNPENVGAITNAMQQITQDETLRQDLRMRGLAQAQKFSWQHTGNQTAAILKRFL
ncbi:glycosyl transferase group 1 [[Leptolyngbya] sp. PCC 7376]|uniref:glycosyltransferase family 4 protein n=1 Tax=[Leptolyngbya] sp. PCC 7376 TaxID=111781 RepID=UPI00029F1E9B|nr:glycosyltransferase family 1 protein [[Leptolyngbya] sp. PCC 7376]AFY37001.1 glycosyl transferase group 1 [[Leptolyngbya] sp. PCC 7376]